MRRVAIASLLSLLPLLAHADPTQEALQEIMKCSEVTDPAARLSCFDIAVPRAKRALAEHQAQQKRSFLDWFGFSRPPRAVTRPQDFGKPPAAEPGEITQITALVSEFATTPRRKAIFILDNGQIWRQIESDTEQVYEPAPGRPMRVIIEIGIVGGYNLSIEGRNGIVKVNRLK